jgi:hypothetical protein
MSEFVRISSLCFKIPRKEMIVCVCRGDHCERFDDTAKLMLYNCELKVPAVEDKYERFTVEYAV